MYCYKWSWLTVAERSIIRPNAMYETLKSTNFTRTFYAQVFRAQYTVYRHTINQYTVTTRRKSLLPVYHYAMPKRRWSKSGNWNVCCRKFQKCHSKTVLMPPFNNFPACGSLPADWNYAWPCSTLYGPCYNSRQDQYLLVSHLRDQFLPAATFTRRSVGTHGLVAYSLISYEFISFILCDTKQT